MRWVAPLRLVALVVWLIATSHCRLAALPALGFLTCAHAQTAPDCDHPDNDDSCASVESGSYRSEDSLRLVVAPDCLLTLSEVPRVVSRQADSVVALSMPSTGPPRLASWRFLIRAAGNPRAPSVVPS